ncbi:MAG: beta-1,6-N-acetylglucosaminyltransferase [Burkholderiaceae bacterium]
MSGLVFGIVSAIHSPATVTQLCESLAPHRVVIHHDPSQQPEFAIDLPHVSFVPNPKQTGWNSFHFTEGLFHLLDHCLQQPEMAYFQLLTPTCLPIKPLSEFEFALNQSPADAHCEGIDLFDDKQALVNFGYRTFVPDQSIAMRALYKASAHYFGQSGRERMQAGLSVRTGASPSSLNHLIENLNHLAKRGWFCRHPFTDDFRPYMGSTWFGAHRDAAQWLLTQFREDPRVDYFRNISFPEELLISTLLHNSPFELAPAHHEILAFDHARPLDLTVQDLDDLKKSCRFFGRKFADDPGDPARREVLKLIKESEVCLTVAG